MDRDDCVKPMSVRSFVFARAGYSKRSFPLQWITRFARLHVRMNPFFGRCCITACPRLAKDEPPSRDVVRRPEISRYVEGWGRIGDTGFVAHDKKNRALLGAAWLRRPTDKSDASPELALAVKPEHRRHGIGTALLTQLVRANPDHSTISVSFVAGKPVLRLYERFGFKVVEQRPDAVVMHRAT